MNNAKTNQGARKNIQLALLELMTQKSFHKISITEIIQLAHVSRGTYYYHYYTQIDILNEIINNFIIQLKKACDGLNNITRSDLDVLLVRILDCVYANRFALKCILGSDVSDMFKNGYHDFLETFVLSIIENSNYTYEQHKISFEYFFSGHFCLVQNWILDDCKLSTEEFAHVLNKISAIIQSDIC